MLKKRQRAQEVHRCVHAAAARAHASGPVAEARSPNVLASGHVPASS
tara:strand:- start:1055 stop:1195 length:141 start_codon:yes stop_codon:yes gene_type:complete